MPNDHSLMFVPSPLKPETVKAIEAMGMSAQQIADRWVSGWAAETLALEASGDLLPQLRAQAEKENEVYLQMQPGGPYNHLARHEAAQMFDFALEP